MAIIQAATVVFLEQGFGAASMDAIAETAGVSKQTVYSHFGSKEALFGAIIEGKCNEVLHGLSTPSLTAGDGLDPRQMLIDMAESFLATVLAAPGMALLRVVVAESGRFPELAEVFYRAGPTIAIENLARLLADLDKDGALSVPDPTSSAGLFYAMLRGDLYFRHLLGLSQNATKAEREAVVYQAVAAFLAAHTPP
ncbi:MAG: TetR/AcrR family transcriptional regulator [Alphaproteobacteria bacterium]|jgi:TetR/AcrR family transcriptional regulator, mexJK operon transcriptional repressor|nr:TetR/AcrR family transcriptional regulator [Alphaproteobacteria bacterium]MBT7944450.1 TetR/AcrR family transcriptional regulator [Alphaproteobacteria bacterium]